MAAKLTESDWKANAAKCKIKSVELQKALADYEKIDEDDHDDLLEMLGELKQLTLELKKSKDVTGNPAAVKYVGELHAAVEAEHREVTKDRVEADKAAKKSVADEEAAKAHDDGDEEDDDPAGKDSTIGKLVTLALQQLKSNEELRYEFIVCDAKPHPGVMIAKKISPKHKEMLSEATGSKKFLHVGVCRCEKGHVVFEPEKPVSGLAPKLKLALAQHTGKKHAVRVGAESSEDETAGAAGGAASATKTATTAEAPAAAPAQIPELVKAPKDWDTTCNALVNHVKGLGKAIQAQCAGEAGDFTKEIDGYMEKLEARISKLGARLAHSLNKANEAKDVAGRKTELNNAKALIAQTIKDVKPLAVVIDENPFVKTNFTGELTGGLTRAAQAVSRGLAAA